MYFNYQTERLNIRILNSEYADMVLHFLSKNQKEFELYESSKVPSYYTTEFQANNLHNEFQACLSRKYIRFYVFTKDDPNTIIGTVSFGNFREMPYSDTTIGYKFDSDYRNMGYATEAVDFCISTVFNEFHVHRIEALILPTNLPSIRLVTRLGFDYEGTAKQNLRVNGAWRDHEQYSIINSLCDY